MTYHLTLFQILLPVFGAFFIGMMVGWRIATWSRKDGEG